MSQLTPLILYGETWLVNPFKVAILLETLGLPYTVTNIDFLKVKDPSYVAINPNGRLPALTDPNNDNFTIWESGAIIEYLVEKYDKEHKISFEAGSNEYYLAKQWLHFQMSGQGPYYGQASWFMNFHREKLPSAIERYQNEIRRVSGVLDKWLEPQDRDWLVGNKMTYADLAFLPFQQYVTRLLGVDFKYEEEFPHMHGWIRRMENVPAVVEATGKKPAPPNFSSVVTKAHEKS